MRTPEQMRAWTLADIAAHLDAGAGIRYEVLCDDEARPGTLVVLRRTYTITLEGEAARAVERPPLPPDPGAGSR